MPGVPWHTQILADQLTLFQPEGTDYAHLITTGTPGFSDLPTALILPSTIYVNKGRSQSTAVLKITYNITVAVQNIYSI